MMVLVGVFIKDRYSQRQANVYTSTERLYADHVNVKVAVTFDVLVALTPAISNPTVI